MDIKFLMQKHLKFGHLIKFCDITKFNAILSGCAHQPSKLNVIKMKISTHSKSLNILLVVQQNLCVCVCVLHMFVCICVFIIVYIIINLLNNFKTFSKDYVFIDKKCILYFCKNKNFNSPNLLMKSKSDLEFSLIYLKKIILKINLNLFYLQTFSINKWF